MQARFKPHTEVSRAAAGLGLDATEVMNGMLEHKLTMEMHVSQGPLCCIDSPSQLLKADEATYKSTEAAYLSALVSLHLLQARHLFSIMSVLSKQHQRLQFLLQEDLNRMHWSPLLSDSGKAS